MSLSRILTVTLSITLQDYHSRSLPRRRAQPWKGWLGLQIQAKSRPSHSGTSYSLQVLLVSTRYRIKGHYQAIPAIPVPRQNIKINAPLTTNVNLDGPRNALGAPYPRARFSSSPSNYSSFEASLCQPFGLDYGAPELS
jgi:hypothetical protein